MSAEHRDRTTDIPMKRGFDAAALRRENRTYRGSGGVSAQNRCGGFAPAFLDLETGMVYRACFADGRPAPMHLLDGLPAEVVVDRHASGTVRAVKGSIVAGFLGRGRFFTREQAARAMDLLTRLSAGPELEAETD